MAVISPLTFPFPAMKKPAIRHIEGLNSFGGLKAQNAVTCIGVSPCSDKSFAMVMSSIKFGSLQRKRGKSGGGALSSTCNAGAEIFKIAAIMNGLTLVGVAFGFILLRIEAIVEESES